MPLHPGDTFFVDIGGGSKFWVVADVADGIAITYPFDKGYQDDLSCVLTPTDHPPLKTEQAIVYAWGVELSAEAQQKLVGLWSFEPRKPLSAAALDKVRKGGLESRQVSPRIKAILHKSRLAAAKGLI